MLPASASLHCASSPGTICQGVIRQRLVQAVAQVPTVGEVEARRRDELSFRADAFEEHHQLQLEKDDRIDGRSGAACGRLLSRSARWRLIWVHWEGELPRWTWAGIDPVTRVLSRCHGEKSPPRITLLERRCRTRDPF